MSTLNASRQRDYVRAPRLRVLLDGNPIPGAVAASWASSSHFAPDTWNATFAVNADPRFNLHWFDKIDVPAFVDIQAGISGPGGAVAWKSLGTGHVDDLSSSPDGGTVQLRGRDLGALLIEQKTAEAFQNQTSSQIAQTLAARHGLTADVTATTTLSQRLFGGNFTHETHAVAGRSTNEWDLLVRLAQAEGFNLYVTGRTLHFKPLPTVNDVPYLIGWRPGTVSNAAPVSNAMNLQMSHKLMLARPVSVIVQSFNSRSGATVKAVANTGGARSGGVVNGSVFTTLAKFPQKYQFIRPNLTQAQAQALANSMLVDITTHERNISWEEPATTFITPRDVVRLQGTNTDFDQVYFVETVQWSIDIGGYTMRVEAKNRSAAATQADQNALTD